MDFQLLRIPLAIGMTLASAVSFIVIWLSVPDVDYKKVAAGFLLGGMFAVGFCTWFINWQNTKKMF